jgi:hypothetical protein
VCGRVCVCGFVCVWHGERKSEYGVCDCVYVCVLVYAYV